MPPKKAKKKDDKKDEKKEQEKEPERPDGPKSWVVGGWSALQGVTGVMEKLGEGDQVIINEGTYDEVFNITKKTVVTGAGATPEEQPILAKGVVTTAPCTVSNLNIQSQCIVETGDATLTDCTFSNADNLLTLYPNTAPTVSQCVFKEARNSCLYCFPNAKGVVSKCTFSGDSKAENNTCAVTMDNCCTTIKDNIIKGTSTGIYAFCAEPVADATMLQKPLIQGNTITSCTGTAFHLDKGGNCQFTGNEIHESGYWGVTVSGGALGVLTKNVISDQVRIREGSRPSLHSMSFCNVS